MNPVVDISVGSRETTGTVTPCGCTNACRRIPGIPHLQYNHVHRPGYRSGPRELSVTCLNIRYMRRRINFPQSGSKFACNHVRLLNQQR